MKLMTVPTEFKALGDAGEFDGYASVFNNTDEGADVVRPGAFKDIVTTRDGMVRILNHHNQRDPVGKAAVSEDSHGLHFRGKLVLEVPSARTVYALMKTGILDGMSIGYDVLTDGAKTLTSGVRELIALKLWEISTVTFGMNQLARIENVKGAGEIKTIREFEEWLRDAGGFSRSEAKQLALGGYNALAGPRDASDGCDALTAAVDDFRKMLRAG